MSGHESPLVEGLGAQTAGGKQHEVCRCVLIDHERVAAGEGSRVPSQSNGSAMPPGDPPFPLDRRRFRLRFRMRMPSTPAALELAVDQITRVAESCDCCGAGGETDLEIALREALANAIFHGNEGEPHRRVRLRVYGGEQVGMVIAIRDEGAGFDPGQVPDPTEGDLRLRSHGRGLFLMRELMDHVRYLKGGREVVLFKACGDHD